MATSDAMGFGQATSTTACFISRRRSPRQAKPHVLDGASRPLHKHRLLVLRLQVRVPSTPWAGDGHGVGADAGLPCCLRLNRTRRRLIETRQMANGFSLKELGPTAR